MPQIGERRSGATETVEWDGHRWNPVEETPPPAAPEPEGALSRFFGGAMSTSPLNPMNLVRAVAHPIDTLGGAFVDPLINLFKAAEKYKEFASQPGKDASWLPLVQSVEHLGGAVPVIGPTAIKAGEKIGNGDVAGGTGELAGLASGALVPDAVKGTPGAMKTVGGAVERGGTAMTNARGISVGGVHVPISTLGVAEAVLRHDPLGAVVAATPYALKYGGKATRMAGEALEGLRDNMNARRAASVPWQDENGNWDPAAPSRRARGTADQNRAYAEEDMRQRQADATDELNNEPPEVPDFHQTQTWGRGGYPGMGAKAAEMGDATIDSLRRGGYDVGDSIRTQADLDRVAAGRKYNPAALRFAFSEDRPTPEEAVAILKGDNAPRPTTPSPITEDTAVPDFTYEAGDADIPGQTIGKMKSNPLPETPPTPQQAALKALMNLDSFRGLR